MCPQSETVDVCSEPVNPELGKAETAVELRNRALKEVIGPASSF